MSRPTLNPATSLFLDASRILAALLVVLHHAFERPFHDGSWTFPGRQAVVIFFVISGFVIAYATDGQTDWRRYAVSRLARIYSVAVPAMLLTWLLVVAQQTWLGAGVSVLESSTDKPLVRVLLSLAFVNQFWNLTVGALTNGPYWSLCYEVWYYVLFAIAMFARGPWRVLGLALVLVMVGPRIVLLLPIWLTGVVAYYLQRDRDFARSALRRPLFWASLLALALAAVRGSPADAVSEQVRASLLDGYLHVGDWRVFIGGDSRFPSDWLLGLLFAVCVCLSARSPESLRAEGPVARATRTCSSYTFSLYLFHVPILVFAHAALARHLPVAVVPWVMLAVILGGVAVVGRYTEHRKAPWVRVFSRLLGRQARSSA